MNLDDLLCRHTKHDLDMAALVKLILPLTHQVCSLHAKVDKVMEKLDQLAADLTALTTTVSTIGAGVATIKTGVQGLETTAANLQQALNNQGNTTPEVDAAIAALQAQVGTVGGQVQDVVSLLPPAPTP